MKTPRLLPRALPLLLALACAPAALANVRLPSIFSDHMVLQRGVPVPVWGWAEPGEEISVTIAGQTQTTKADAAGKWRVKLAPLQSAETLNFTVKGRNTLTVTDVLVGEVWLCSGQSNMAMSVEKSQDFDKEKAAAKFPPSACSARPTARPPRRRSRARARGSCVRPRPSAASRRPRISSAAKCIRKSKPPSASSIPPSAAPPSRRGPAWTRRKTALNSSPSSSAGPSCRPAGAESQADFVKQVAGFKDATAKARAEGKPAPRPPRKPTEPSRDSNHPANLFNGKIMPLIPLRHPRRDLVSGREQRRQRQRRALPPPARTPHVGLAHPLGAGRFPLRLGAAPQLP